MKNCSDGLGTPTSVFSGAIESGPDERSRYSRSRMKPDALVVGIRQSGPELVPVGALFIGMGDLKNARLVESFSK